MLELPSCGYKQHEPNINPSMHIPKCFPFVFKHCQTNIHSPSCPATSHVRFSMDFVPTLAKKSKKNIRKYTKKRITAYINKNIIEYAIYNLVI